MENTSSFSQVDRVRSSYFAIAVLCVFSALAIFMLGINGLAFSILAILGIVITPFVYNKPTLFLFFALFIYPLTRILPLDDKFVITGTLYTISMPCVFWLIKNKFRAISADAYYLWAMVMYVFVVLLNYLRPETGIIDLAKEFGRTFFAIFAVLATYNYIASNQENLQKFTRYISYLFNGIALIAIAQYITGMGGMNIEGFYRIRGTFFNFNEYGYVISIFICFALFILLTTQTHRLYWIASIVLNLVALAGTFSKTSIINTALVFVIMSMFLPWKRKFQLFAALILIGTAVSAFLVTSGTFTTLVARFTNTASLEWRYEMWNRLENMILQGNILFGQGINASRNFLEVLMPRGESFAPHNVYLETAYNLGIVGLIPFVLSFLFILFKGISIFAGKGDANNYSKIVGASIIVIAVITMVQNFVSNAFYDRAGNVMFWAIVTLLICWGNYYRTGRGYTPISRNDNK